MTQEDQSLPSEDQSSPSEDQSSPSKEKGLVLLDSDVFLMTLVHFANHASLKVGITLFIQGTVISGILIGEKAYFEGISNELKATDLFASDAGDDAIDTFINSFQPPTSSSDIEKENPPLNAQFIHLKNPRIQSGDSFISINREVFWRGRLSRIDGFFLGYSQNTL